MPRLFGLLFSAATLLLLWLYFSDGLATELAALLAGLDIQALALATGLALVNFLCSGVRYRLLLQGMMPAVPSLAHIVQLNLWSLLMAHAAPLGGAADVARFIYQRSAWKMTTALAVRSVLCDRVLAMLSIAATGLLLLPLQLASGVTPALCLLQGGLWVAILIGCLLLWLVAGRYAQAAKGRLAGLAGEVDACFAAIATRGRLSAQIAIGAIYCVSFGLIPWVLLRAAGSEVDPLLFVALSPALLFAQSFPLSYAGWGVREWAAILLAGNAAKVDEAAILSASIGTGFVLLICALPGILLWLRKPSG